MRSEPCVVPKRRAAPLSVQSPGRMPKGPREQRGSAVHFRIDLNHIRTAWPRSKMNHKGHAKTYEPTDRRASANRRPKCLAEPCPKYKARPALRPGLVGTSLPARRCNDGRWPLPQRTLPSLSLATTIGQFVRHTNSPTRREQPSAGSEAIDLTISDCRFSRTVLAKRQVAKPARNAVAEGAVPSNNSSRVIPSSDCNMWDERRERERTHR